MVQKNILLAFGIKQLVIQKICMINCQTGADVHNNLHQSIISYILQCTHNHCNFFLQKPTFFAIEYRKLVFEECLYSEDRLSALSLCYEHQ